MKQIIEKDPDGNIWRKYYINHLNQANGLDIGYYTNGSICWKTNWVNDKIFGIGNWCDTNNKKTILRYHL